MDRQDLEFEVFVIPEAIGLALERADLVVEIGPSECDNNGRVLCGSFQSALRSHEALSGES